MNKKVAIERCGSYEPEELYRALKRAAELAGDLDVAGKTVLLKPNIVEDALPGKAICTHPLFLEAAIRLVRDMGARLVLVGESPGGLPKSHFTGSVSGIADVVKKNNAQWIDFSQKAIEVPCPEGKIIKKFMLTHAVKEADVIISLPKFKTHEIMYLTGAMKNIFGFIQGMGKTRMHFRFPKREDFTAMLVDLNLAVKPAYALMDAVTAMEGPGPSHGKPRHMGLVFASSNLLAMDAAAAAVIGYPPEAVPVNKEALERQLWLSSFSEIEYPGLSPHGSHPGATALIPDFTKIAFKKYDSQLRDVILPGMVKTAAQWSV